MSERRPPHRLISLHTPSGGARDESGQEGTGPRPKTVSQLVGEVRFLVEKQFLRVLVAGELSELRPHERRVYFKLKDQNAFLECSMANDARARLPFDLDEGLAVVAQGKLTVFRSRVQLDVKHMEPAGIGALNLAFEQLKEKLAAEGLFDDDKKRPLPLLPRCVGLVTSKRGAAVRDMLKVLEQRMPGVAVLLAPTRVQGAESAPYIIEALRRLDESGRCDVILLGRGGGSLEDLWAFNDAALARAVRSTRTPVIAAVGHETDVTLTCLAADARAATPSHAAERAVPNKSELYRRIARDRRQLEQRARALLGGAALELERTAQRLGDPHALLRPRERQLSRLGQRLDDASARRAKGARAILEGLSERLARRSPERTLAERRRRAALIGDRLVNARPHARVARERAGIERQRAHLDALAVRLRNGASRSLGDMATKLRALSPLAVLERGYALVRTDDEERRLVRSIAGVAAGDRVRVRLSDGELCATVTERVDTEAGVDTGASSGE